MAHDVFVSYSTKDKPFADGVCAGLEAEGIRCWVAPRDILPGKDWGEAIIDAIGESRVMVVVFSESANESPQVKREVQRAFEKGVTVVPLRIDGVMPAKTMAYYLSAVHWLDATPPLEGHIHKLVEIVRQLLPATDGQAMPAAPAPVAAASPPTPQPSRLEYSTPPTRAESGMRLALAICMAVALLAVAVVSVALFFRPRPALVTALPATAPVPVAAAATTAPADGAASDPAPDAVRLQSDQAVAQIFQDLRKMDTQIGLIDRAFSKDMSDAAVQAVAALNSTDGDFVSYRNVPGTQNGQASASGANVVERPVAALQALGAKPADVVSFADNLLAVRMAEDALSKSYDNGVSRAQWIEVTCKLKFGPDEARAQMAKLNEQAVRARVEAFHTQCFTAHVSALRILRSLHSGLPADANAQLGALKNVQPGQLVDDVQLAALDGQLASDRKRNTEQLDSLTGQIGQLLDRHADQCSATLRAPFKLTNFPMDQLGGMFGNYPIDARGSETDAIASALDAGREGCDENKVACLFAYAEIFSKIDPLAEEYARASCQFTVQAYRLGCKRGLFLSKLLDGPAKEGGLREGDVLVDYGGQAVIAMTELGAAMKVMPAGEPVRVEFLRRDEQGRFQRQAATLPRGGSLGATFLPI